MDAPELLGTLDRPIAYHRCFVAVAGSVAGAVFLSQLVYWARRVPDGREGWLWKTGREWEAETGLRRAEQEAARKKLCALGILEERLTGIPARLHFRLNANKLASSLNSTNLDAESAELDCRTPANLDAAKPQTNTWTTHVITPLPPCGGGELVYPLLRAEERTAIADMVACLPATIAQQILDELAGNIRAGTIRKTAPALARELVRRAKAGTFRSELGLAIAAERAAKADAATQKAAEDARRNTPRNPQKAVKSLAEARAIIKKRGTS